MVEGSIPLHYLSGPKSGLHGMKAVNRSNGQICIGSQGGFNFKKCSYTERQSWEMASCEFGACLRVCSGVWDVGFVVLTRALLLLTLVGLMQLCLKVVFLL